MNRRSARVFRLHDSLVVVLPKDWTRGMEVNAGEEVEMLYNGKVTIQKLGGEPDG